MDWMEVFTRFQGEYEDGHIGEQDWKNFCAVMLPVVVRDYDHYREQVQNSAPSFGFGGLFDSDDDEL